MTEMSINLIVDVFLFFFPKNENLQRLYFFFPAKSVMNHTRFSAKCTLNKLEGTSRHLGHQNAMVFRGEYTHRLEHQL